MKKLDDFREGRDASATIMPQIVKGYSAGQLELITGWFAAQPHPDRKGE